MVEHKSSSKHEVHKRNADYRGQRQQNTVAGSETTGQRISNQCIILKPVVLPPAYGQKNQTKPKILQETVVLNNKCKQYSNNAVENCNSNRKLLQSKIPVLKNRSKLQPLSCKCAQNAVNDATLSAADRRQKFHQSRLRCSRTEAPKVPLQTIQPVQYCKILPALPVQVAVPYVPFLNPKVNLPKLPKIQNHPQYSNANPSASIPLQEAKTVPSIKTVLPAPKKEIPVAVAAAENSLAVNGKKKKGLPGEFTHFPALCNISPARPPKKRTYVSAVPHLPPILPPPAPPPPSVSASLEQEVK